MKMYVFHDWNGGDHLIFTSQKKRSAFFKQYCIAMIELNEEPPRRGEDYSMYEAEVDPDFEEYWK